MYVIATTSFPYLVAAGRHPQSSFSLRKAGLEPHLVRLRVVRHSKNPGPGPARTLNGAQSECVLFVFLISI